MRVDRILALAIIVLLTTACGGTSSDDVDAGDGDAGQMIDATAIDAPPPDPTLEDLCSDGGGYSQFFDALLTCNPEFEFMLGRFPTGAEISAACYGNFEDYFDDGTMSLANAESWATCLEYINNLDCMYSDFDAPNPCSNLIIGSQGEGEKCEEHEQCAGDAYCKPERGCGTCAPLKADWEVCNTRKECLSGHCSSVTEPSVCRPFGFAGTLCTGDDDCVGRLFCNDDEPRLCEEPKAWAVGDACAETFEDSCGFPFSNLHCNAVGLGGDDTCAEYLELGDDCVLSLQCDFKHYETCDVDDTAECVAPTIVAEGDDCSWAKGAMCDSGFFCDHPHDDGGTCVAEPAIGDSCEDNDDCGILMDCDSNDECAYGDYSALCPAPE